MGTDLDEHYERLLALLVELDSLLTACGDVPWAEWAHRNTELIQQGQRRGVASVRTAFGGMGSLSDLVICPENGHQVSGDRIALANSELDRLRGGLLLHATALDRLLNKS
ncbi:DUF6966 domain-containing protein [Aquihabitans daechungensis]|uniref:DUF6966 domain-containing protein n=1 Tax=Aquihabitans daechungensis TaxID=1052257 RepID=UPI003B9EFA19